MSKKAPLSALPLFSGPKTTGPDPRARTSDPETSHAAAKSMVGEAEAQRKRIVAHLWEVGPRMADQLDEELGFRVTSAGRRLSELEEAKLVEALDRTGKTRSGRRARYWKAVEPEGSE